jgi:hypothetical protein
MRRALEGADMELPDAPARWGALRQHVFYGALYHGIVLLANRRYAAVKPHRALSVRQEFRLYLKRLALMPWHWLDRVAATRASCAASYPYHLALLQLEHDASFRDHGPFATQSDFVETVIDGLRRRRAAHHHLVFKAHPLEDGRAPLRADIRRAARAGIAEDPGAFRARRQARALLDSAIGGHGELHIRATGALARTSAQVLRGRRLRQAGVRLGPADGRILPRPKPPDSAAYRCSATTCCGPRSFPEASTPRADGAVSCAKWSI